MTTTRQTTGELHTSNRPIVYQTSKGTPYLQAPGASTIAATRFDLGMMGLFLDTLTNVDSPYVTDKPHKDNAAALVKAAGQLCYMSFGAKRTLNANTDQYINHLLESGHGSVLEHANFTLLLWGISRSVTHELVRHRAGFSFSQVSQRYVGADAVRFVERPEYQHDEALHNYFCKRIDVIRAEYESLISTLARDFGQPQDAEQRRDIRKRVQQTARSLLPNETEAPIIVTANARAWRHFLEMRSAPGAEVEIRRLALTIWAVLFPQSPLLFGDYERTDLPDGTSTLTTKWRKV